MTTDLPSTRADVPLTEKCEIDGETVRKVMRDDWEVRYLDSHLKLLKSVDTRENPGIVRPTGD